MSDLVERLRQIGMDDHTRGCEGRNYTCDCGFDERIDRAVQEAAARITELEQQLAARDGEIVAYLRAEADMRFRLHDEQPVDGYNHTRGIAVAMAADAIASGAYRSNADE